MAPSPIKFLALSAHVSPWTTHSQVLDKTLLSGPGRGLPFCNKMSLLLFCFRVQFLSRKSIQLPVLFTLNELFKTSIVLPFQSFIILGLNVNLPQYLFVFSRVACKPLDLMNLGFSLFRSFKSKAEFFFYKIFFFPLITPCFLCPEIPNRSLIL